MTVSYSIRGEDMDREALCRVVLKTPELAQACAQARRRQQNGSKKPEQS